MFDMFSRKRWWFFRFFPEKDCDVWYFFRRKMDENQKHHPFQGKSNGKSNLKKQTSALEFSKKKYGSIGKNHCNHIKWRITGKWVKSWICPNQTPLENPWIQCPNPNHDFQMKIVDMIYWNQKMEMNYRYLIVSSSVTMTFPYLPMVIIHILSIDYP